MIVIRAVLDGVMVFLMISVVMVGRFLLVSPIVIACCRVTCVVGFFFIVLEGV